MKNKQHEFYSSISEYYHEIFPYNPAQLQFIQQQVGNLNGKRILDIGCATGALSYQLAEAGAIVTGIDLNEDLLHQANKNKLHSNLTFLKADMLELERIFSPDSFDAVVCFGNTLVHLPSGTQVEKMLHGVRNIAEKGAVLMLQILNYDYIIEEHVTALPVIESENIQFVRRYIISEGEPQITFSTQLHLKRQGHSIENDTRLLALRSKDLVGLLKDEGYTDISLFSNFKGDDYGGKHIPLVVRAVAEG